MQNLNPIVFPTSYDAILNRINTIDPIGYAKTRNFLHGQVSYLSPYISRGVISPKQILTTLFDKGYSLYQSEKFIQELTWREYYQRVWQVKKNHIGEDLKQAQVGVAHYDMITSVMESSTGITIIDEQIEQLHKIGYIHNHIRMYLASIVCNIGKAHWKTPANWMYYHLIDGDIASNNCSWQWVSGSFSTKKYFCNQENINKYTHSTQSGTFLDCSYADLPKSIPVHLNKTTPLSLFTNLPPTPFPKLDVNKPTLIYNSYNLDPLWHSHQDFNRILLLEPSHYQVYPVNDNVLHFIIALSKNIPDIQLYVGEIHQIVDYFQEHHYDINKNIFSKEHPLFEHYPGIKENRDWMFLDVTGYYPSFFNYWKKCLTSLRKQFNL